MRKRYQRRLWALALLPALVRNAAAMDVSWGGFLNATGALSDSAAPYLPAEIDDRGAFGDTTFGANLGLALGEGLQLAAQVATHPGHSDLELDWAFASFRLSDTLDLAAGQLKYPGNLVSEYIDAGYLYPWIRPPQEIYSHTEVSAAMTLEQFRGARLLYSGNRGEFDYDLQLYAGATEEETMNHDKMIGAVASVSVGTTRLLAGYNSAEMEMIGLPAAPMNGKRMTVLSLGATTERDNVVAYAELVWSKTEDVPILDTLGGYATLGYRFGETLPHLTYSFLDQDSGIGQTAWTLGLRRELTASSALKLEWQRVRPDAATAAALAAAPMLAGQAGLFTSIPDEQTVDVFSLSVNVFF